uniref:Uncharacterized protein n=1 Tax=Candidatus Kentrum sp. DK TaxID=2126562 RepID=A0A450SE85_9GAMM|nr:MAG: hypothetical protein BECKDK2373B_GA0170837_102013 [Candidatus Kentron sp. DK]VFJ51011.1 MAG: hypothetical protein BECKDK2373C_GA0170839_10317 [Candidatus Kentron sp. DK]
MKKSKLPPILAREDFDSGKEYELYRSAEAGEWISSGDVENHREKWQKLAASAAHNKDSLLSPKQILFPHSRDFAFAKS